MSTFADVFSSEETQQFNDWMAKFDEVTLDASDPAGVADRMVVTLEIFGSGNVKPAEQEQETLFKFAQDLYQELAPK